MQDTVNEEELKCLYEASRVANIDPMRLKTVNPWTQQGKIAELMQVAVSETNPQLAARWRLEAGESVSLGAAAAKAGLLEMSKAQHQELMELDYDYRTGVEEAQARREADLLASMESKTEQLSEARRKRQEAAAKRARQPQGYDNTTGHNAEFLRRIGGIQNLKGSPSRLIPGR